MPVINRGINWRELLLRYAADILESFHEDELARLIRDFRVPLIDGGACYRLKRDADRKLQVESGGYQSLNRMEYAEGMWVVPLPTYLWDPPKPKEKVCECECCRKRAAG